MAAAEGEFPKGGNDPLYASEVNDNDRNIAICQTIHHATVLSEDATVVDATYETADSDIVSDSGGYNNTINTGQTTARFVEDRYITSAVIYDNFDDNSIDTGLWTVTENTTVNGEATVTETGQHMELYAKSPAGGGGSGNALLTSDTAFSDYLRWTVDTLSVVGPTSAAIAEVNVNGVVIVDKQSAAGGTYEDYATGVWELIKIGTNSYNLYKSQVFVRNFSVDLAGFVEFRANTAQSNGSDGVTSHEINDVYLSYDSTSFVQTETKTFSSNVKSIFVYIRKDISMTNSSITYDVSSDGGSNFEKTAQSFNQWVTLDGDDTDIELKINLNRGTTGTPWLYGYTFLVRT